MEYVLGSYAHNLLTVFMYALTYKQSDGEIDFALGRFQVDSSDSGYIGTYGPKTKKVCTGRDSEIKNIET